MRGVRRNLGHAKTARIEARAEQHHLVEAGRKALAHASSMYLVRSLTPSRKNGRSRKRCVASAAWAPAAANREAYGSSNRRSPSGRSASSARTTAIENAVSATLCVA